MKNLIGRYVFFVALIAGFTSLYGGSTPVADELDLSAANDGVYIGEFFAYDAAVVPAVVACPATIKHHRHTSKILPPCAIPTKPAVRGCTLVSFGALDALIRTSQALLFPHHTFW